MHNRRVISVSCSAIEDVETVSPKDAARMNVISDAIQVRLQKLHESAPDDKAMVDMTEEAMKWDEKELLKEGELLKLNRLAGVDVVVRIHVLQEVHELCLDGSSRAGARKGSIVTGPFVRLP
jgi:hypothetical protein